MTVKLLRLTLVALAALTATGCVRTVDIDALTSEIDARVESYPDAVVAIAIRDPLTGLVFGREENRSFHAASTMKVPVMIEVFRRAERGDFSLDDSLLVVNRFRSIVDGSEYAIGDDSDDTIYEQLGSRMPIRQLVEQMITVSSNLATNLLIDFVSADSVQATSERLGTTSMRTLRGVEDLKAFERGLSNSTTARDLAVLMEALMKGQAVNPKADREMVEILKRQRFNEMIPAGLPSGTVVAHKTGQITGIHHDAGIVFSDHETPYVLVILIEGLADDSDSAAVGSEISQVVYERLRPH